MDIDSIEFCGMSALEIYGLYISWLNHDSGRFDMSNQGFVKYSFKPVQLKDIDRLLNDDDSGLFEFEVQEAFELEDGVGDLKKYFMNLPVNIREAAQMMGDISNDFFLASVRYHYNAIGQSET